MFREIRTAVIAAVSPTTRSQALHALSEAGIELLGAESSGAAALEMLRHLRPDLLVADAELPGMDGCTLVRRILNGFCLPVRPAAILLHCRSLALPDAQGLSGAVLVEKPVQEDAFRAALAYLRTAAPRFTAAQLQRADELLDALGVPQHIGRDCLKSAALICAADERGLHSLSRFVYPQIGEMCACTARQAERAMRHAIDLAWQSDQFDNQYRIFADTVDAGRGQPTCSEMISRLADILRLEG